jgi:pimeloyl-ACP methyl ester carboxylesterase
MTTDNARMQLDVKGSGAPLILVGGGLTGWLSWQPHQARLAPKRMVARAQPLSVQYGLENRRLPESYSVRSESRALGGAIAGIVANAPVDLVAWSYGALVTLDFALEHPEHVRTLTLIEPPAFWVLGATGTADEASNRESAELRAAYAKMRTDVTEEQLASFVCSVGLCPPGKNPTELPQWPSWVLHRRSLRAGDAPWAHEDDAARLRAFDKPVLLVKGVGSAHFLHAIIDGLARTMPRAEVLELPGGHAPQMVAMDAFLDRLETFHAR